MTLTVGKEEARNKYWKKVMKENMKELHKAKDKDMSTKLMYQNVIFHALRQTL